MKADYIGKDRKMATCEHRKTEECKRPQIKAIFKSALSESVMRPPFLLS